mgnify:CR=1 FL=1
MSAMQPINTLISSFSNFIGSNPPRINPEAFNRSPSPNNFSALNAGFADAFAPLFGASGFSGAPFNFTQTTEFFSPFAGGGAFGGSGVGTFSFGSFGGGASAFGGTSFAPAPVMDMSFFGLSSFGNVPSFTPNQNIFPSGIFNPFSNFNPFATGSFFSGPFF